jgi:hypothetical protein
MNAVAKSLVDTWRLVTRPYTEISAKFTHRAESASGVCEREAVNSCGVDMEDLELRREVTATTNIIESYNAFAKWLSFGGEGVIAENDPDEQQKRLRYNDLVASRRHWGLSSNWTENRVKQERSGIATGSL